MFYTTISEAYWARKLFTIQNRQTTVLKHAHHADVVAYIQEIEMW